MYIVDDIFVEVGTFDGNVLVSVCQAIACRAGFVSIEPFPRSECISVGLHLVSSMTGEPFVVPSFECHFVTGVMWFEFFPWTILSTVCFHVITFRCVHTQVLSIPDRLEDKIICSVIKSPTVSFASTMSFSPEMFREPICSSKLCLIFQQIVASKSLHLLRTLVVFWNWV